MIIKYITVESLIGVVSVSYLSYTSLPSFVLHLHIYYGNSLWVLTLALYLLLCIDMSAH